MKTCYLWGLTALLSLPLTSCFAPKEPSHTESATAELIADSTFYGILGECTAMSTVQLIGGNGDTLVFYKDSPTSEHISTILGGLEYGHLFAYTLEDSLTVGTMINLTALASEWVHPIEGLEEVEGFKLYPNGEARSINTPMREYKNWSIWNCKLVLEFERTVNGDTFQASDTIAIEKLDMDSLQLNDQHGGIEKYIRQ